ncbi:MAG: hypothetical protein EOP53_09385 [Sphingobacteriales bacterium]|nr:MAG: hypothetical protein EOP53_09385 [Sphingobacteriales bacterium]
MQRCVAAWQTIRVYSNHKLQRCLRFLREIQAEGQRLTVLPAKKISRKGGKTHPSDEIQNTDDADKKSAIK